MLEDPEACGFTNVRDVACAPVDSDASLLGYALAGSGSPITYAPGADVGTWASLGGQASAVLGHSGRSGDGVCGDHLLSVGLHIAF